LHFGCFLLISSFDPAAVHTQQEHDQKDDHDFCIGLIIWTLLIVENRLTHGQGREKAHILGIAVY
jgi:hypothetical protein